MINLKRFTTVLCFGLFAGVISLFCYWGDVGFFSGFVYGFYMLLVLLAFYVLLFVLDYLCTHRFPVFCAVVGRFSNVDSYSRSYSTKASIDIDLSSSTATYTPGTYETRSSYDSIYQTGYGKYTSKKASKTTYKQGADGSYVCFPSLFQSEPKNIVKKFNKVYKRDKMLSRLGLTFWGLAPIWKSFVIFIPFMVNYLTRNTIKPATFSCIEPFAVIIHVGVFVASLFLNPISLFNEEEFAEYDDVGHRPLHMQILGMFSDFAVLKLMQNLIVKYNLTESVMNVSDYNKFFVEDNLYKIASIEFYTSLLMKQLITSFLIELVIYVIFFAIRFLFFRKNRLPIR